MAAEKESAIEIFKLTKKEGLTNQSLEGTIGAREGILNTKRGSPLSRVEVEGDRFLNLLKEQ